LPSCLVAVSPSSKQNPARESHYIEPFLGGGAIMRHKKPASLNIGIDRDPEAVKAVARAGIAENGEAGFHTLAAALPRAGIVGTGEAEFRFETGDGLVFLRSYRFTGDELVYCDPPYLFETRSSGRTRYAYELGHDDEHRALLDIITALPCMVMISGYWSRLYADRLRGWQSIRFRRLRMAAFAPNTCGRISRSRSRCTTTGTLARASASASASSAKSRDGQHDCTACR
jgi:hypothetical protein